MKHILFSFVMLASVSAAQAAADIYVCTDANGVKTYGNIGSNKGCKKVELPGLMTFPAANMKKAGKDFPKVDDLTQRQRDADRRQILNDELKAEQKKLSDLNTQYKGGEPDRLGNERNFAKYQERTEGLKEDINRSQQNIDSLQREINGSN